MPRPIFLAAPENGAGALGLIDKTILELQIVTGGALKGTAIFVPHLQIGDVGIETNAPTYFTRSLQGLNDARIMIAILDGPQVDENVAFLIGCAYASSKPVIGYITDARNKGPLIENAIHDIAHDTRTLAEKLRPHLQP